ncbi:MAG: hypothetical protein ABJD53_16170 [Gammaproteobacteria bacterium]
MSNGSRDGRLAVVASDLSEAVFADGIAAPLLDAVERWSQVEGPLRRSIVMRMRRPYRF